MPLAVTVTLSIRDEKNKVSTSKFRLAAGFTIPEYLNAAVEIAQTVANAVRGRVESASVCLGVDLSPITIKDTAVAGSDRYQKAHFGFASAGGSGGRVFFIPALNESKVAAGSDALNLVDTDVDNFVDFMLNGVDVGGGTIFAPVDGREYDLTALNFAYESFKRK